MPFDFTASDTGSRLRLHLKDENNDPVDLSGATVTLLWRDGQSTLQSRAMTIIDVSTKGLTEYQFEEDELVSPIMTFVVRGTDTEGRTVTSSNKVSVTVRANI